MKIFIHMVNFPIYCPFFALCLGRPIGQIMQIGNFHSHWKFLFASAILFYINNFRSHRQLFGSQKLTSVQTGVNLGDLLQKRNLGHGEIGNQECTEPEPSYQFHRSHVVQQQRTRSTTAQEAGRQSGHDRPTDIPARSQAAAAAATAVITRQVLPQVSRSPALPSFLSQLPTLLQMWQDPSAPLHPAAAPRPLVQ